MAVDTCRRLTDQDINQLLRNYRSSRRQELRDQIVMQYTNLVESVARRFAGSAEPTEDLVQEGYIGLITAVDGYNPDKGVKFSTYATHFVIGQIKHCLRDRGKIIKEPAWLQELNQKVTRVIESLSQELGRMPTHGEIAKLMGMTEDSITDLLTTREVFKVASLDGGEQDDDTSPSYDIDRVKADRAVEFQLPVEEKLVLDTALQKLKDLERTVVHQFYNDGKNQTEIARGLGISCNYVSHILRNATKKLRKILTTEELKEFQRETALVQRNTRGVAEDSSVVDGMTRLYNRRYFETRLEEELNRASRFNYPLAIVFVALDGHQHISRAYGTLKSEDTLRRAAQLINGSVRKVDIVTRHDIQTFGLILPHTGDRVKVVVDRLCEVLGTWLVEENLHTGRAPISLCVGSAVSVGSQTTRNDLLCLAVENIKQIDLADGLPLAA
jgi:RNA polymerase sigma-B factor